LLEWLRQSLDEKEWRFLETDWRFWARPEQAPPQDRDWTTWLFMGGRGAGKTRAGAEWLRHEIEENGAGRIALVAETIAEGREVMVEGVSGLLALPWRKGRPSYKPSRQVLIWPSGAVARLFSAEDPDSLRGSQFDHAWADEFCKWSNIQETWDMLQFGLRLGKRPRQAVTTTPRPIKLLKSLIADPGTVTTHAATTANRANLAPAFFQHIIARFDGTRLGRQELLGEIIDDNPNALWQGEPIERERVREAPPLTRIVIGVDPPASGNAESAACGIIVAGRSASGQGYVLADRTVQGLSPAGWARAVAAAYHDFKADRVIAEVNQGGDMVSQVLRQSDPSIAITQVRATRGKATRAEPVAALYERGLIHHVGGLPKLEAALTAFMPYDGTSVEGQDRIDALVWALTHLMLGGREGEPKIRTL
jgi:phage terminase large subunit-like protein